MSIKGKNIQYATVRGQFAEFSGNVIFDPDKLAQNKFDFVVKVDSINTNVGKRDTHLRSDDFFGTAKYPEIRFTSSKVTHAGGNKYLVDGRLTIKDVSKDLTLEFIYWGEKENPLKHGEMIAGLDARQTLDRLAYHIGDGKFYKIGAVGKDVDIPRNKSKFLVFRHSGESRDPVFSISYAHSGPRFSPG